MRLLHLPTFWTVLLDIAAWFVIHMGVALAIVRIPLERFDARAWPFGPRTWEGSGSVYVRRFRIRKWKRFLPDGARSLGERGFPKRHLTGRSVGYLETFARETCRAEVAHWVIALFAPFFFLWNPPGVGLFMILYAGAENLPLVMAQRYNRLRLLSVLQRKRKGRGTPT